MTCDICVATLYAWADCDDRPRREGTLHVAKRHIAHSTTSGLLFTDLVPAWAETDIEAAVHSRLQTKELPPAPMTPAAEHPERVERFIHRANLMVERGLLRSTDVAITDAWSPLRKLRNDGRVYTTLWELALQRGLQITDHVWRIQVGYAELSRISLCSIRALCRAFRRLEALHYLLRYPTAHDGRVATTYWVRSPNGCRAMLMANRCTHVRILRGRTIELRAQADGRDR